MNLLEAGPCNSRWFHCFVFIEDIILFHLKGAFCLKLVKLVVVYSLHLDRSIAVVRFILVVVVAVFHSFNFFKYGGPCVK